jgi:G3E family GTPase
LIVVLNRLAKKVQNGLKLDGIIIETTGMADPAPVAQTFFVDDSVKAFARLDGIVTLVDAKHIEQHLDEVKPEGAENESVEQVAFADRMLLNKTDLVAEADLERVEARLRAINAFAPILRCTKSQVTVDSVLNIRGFDLDRTLKMDPEFLDTDGEHQHDASVTSLSITQPGNVDLESVQDWVSDLLQNKGNDIYRMKGVLAIANDTQKFVYQAVHMTFNGDFGDEWGPKEVRESKLVFIGKNLDKEALKAGFAACLMTPEMIEKKRGMLRFAVGDKVDCISGSGWLCGEVVAQMYRDDKMPSFMVAPYQVKLNGSGKLICVLLDSDEVVKKC